MSMEFTSQTNEDNTDKEESLENEMILEKEEGIEFSETTQQIEKKNNLEIKISEDKKACTYTFTDEDHTLGNLVRYFLIKDNRVNFAGYDITHPSENTMNVRVQTNGYLIRNIM